MKTIDATFESLEVLPVARLFGQHGVYVLWARNADQRPTYIGEGVVLNRLGEHLNNWAMADVTGVAALLPDKREAVAVEAVLLAAARDLNREPARNSASGKWTGIADILRRHPTLRVNVRGQHPFIHPDKKSSRLQNRAALSLYEYGNGYRIETPWRGLR